MNPQAHEYTILEFPQRSIPNSIEFVEGEVG
jgi:hypothetical protein